MLCHSCESRYPGVRDKTEFSVSRSSNTLNIPHPYEEGMAEQWIATHQERYEKGELVNFAIVL